MKNIILNDYCKYSVGIDTFKFLIPNDSLNVFLKKQGLFHKKRKTTKNIQINEYTTQKYKNNKTHNKKHPFDIKYINLKRGVKSLSNTILILKNSKICHEHSKKNKKSYEYYTEVTFAGLHQPSKDIEPLTIKILKKFLKRFKVYSIDLAVDFDSTIAPNSRNKAVLAQATSPFIEGNGSIKNAPSSLYINVLKIQSKILRVIFYDKYKKQSEYHKENIKEELKNWKRVETTIAVNQKFFKYIQTDELNNQIDNLTYIVRALGGCGLTGLNINFLSRQIQKLKDLRRSISFKAWAIDKIKPPNNIKIGA